MAGDLTRLQMTTEVTNVVGKSLSASAVSGATLQTRVQTYYINWAQRRLARAFDFHELNAVQESAATVADVKRYPMVTGTNNLGLTRPKDIHSIKVIDSANSRTLRRYSPRWFQKKFPRPENFTTGRPDIYTRWINSLDFMRIPDAVYTLHIWYPQWPTVLTADSQLSDFEQKDELLVTLTVMETYLALEEYQDAAVWAAKAKGMLIDAINVQGDMDWEPTAEPFRIGGEIVSGTTWTDPAGVSGDLLYGGNHE